MDSRFRGNDKCDILKPMAKIFDPQIVNPLLTGFLEALLITKGSLVATKPLEVVSKPIEEYDDRMRIKASVKFDVAVYIAAINFYFNQVDMQAHRARGALVLYLDTEVA